MWFCVWYKSFSVKFLEVIKPFCAVLPEIQKPERRVCMYILFRFVNYFLTLFYLFFWQLIYLAFYYRFNSERRCYGQPSPCSFSWCAARFVCFTLIFKSHQCKCVKHTHVVSLHHVYCMSFSPLLRFPYLASCHQTLQILFTGWESFSLPTEVCSHELVFFSWNAFF